MVREQDGASCQPRNLDAARRNADDIATRAAVQVSPSPTLQSGELASFAVSGASGHRCVLLEAWRSNTRQTDLTGDTDHAHEFRSAEPAGTVCSALGELRTSSGSVRSRAIAGATTVTARQGRFSQYLSAAQRMPRRQGPRRDRQAWFCSRARPRIRPLSSALSRTVAGYLSRPCRTAAT